ncbi:DoxX family protein [Paenibacillus mucilaginosus]|uniref:DoxX family protein n=2 Tax=Paenibacillus mucilaginosus TaxID=61624 RepID=I0BG50_9BACL|nr:hypothetical protein [Paenibacillus mucilaginosus]AEI40545.1 hypothetical protein KNP414_01984 [Paenibacillus mucilaginosus KNP414]AFH61347.1 DoxX family protein [Paenibacillus mucilaginosus K02]MCG7216314.1 hypothetical protein [Paenibacillus mucilaginosus]WDM29711.1 hypothetical protein KCX80_11420 [Paenibacillus mucilaginosus]
MLPFYALVAACLLFRILGFIGLPYFDEWHSSLQGAVAVMFMLTASAHWGTRRPDLIRMVPPALPRPDLIVTVTGLLEVAGAIGILFTATSKVASIGLAVLLVAMFPANVRAAREQLSIGGRPVPKLLLRIVLQIVFLAAVLLAGAPSA